MSNEDQFAALTDQLDSYTPEAHEVIHKIINGNVKILALTPCDPELFSRVKEEAMSVRLGEQGQELDENHPTTKYVGAQDKNWKMKAGTIHQYSLYNSEDDFLYFQDDHHWSDAARKFNSRLKAIPEFFERYFGRSELQNFRLQSLTKEGELGLHREKIIAIPHREHHWKLRFHLPVVTNPGVEFLMDNQSFKMEAGTVYAFNQGALHGVRNSGDELRVHLIWDCYLNEHLLTGLFAPAAAREGI